MEMYRRLDHCVHLRSTVEMFKLPKQHHWFWSLRINLLQDGCSQYWHLLPQVISRGMFQWPVLWKRQTWQSKTLWDAWTLSDVILVPCWKRHLSRQHVVWPWKAWGSQGWEPDGWDIVPVPFYVLQGEHRGFRLVLCWPELSTLQQWAVLRNGLAWCSALVCSEWGRVYSRFIAFLSAIHTPLLRWLEPSEVSAPLKWEWNTTSPCHREFVHRVPESGSPGWGGPGCSSLLFFAVRKDQHPRHECLLSRPSGGVLWVGGVLWDGSWRKKDRVNHTIACRSWNQHSPFANIEFRYFQILHPDTKHQFLQ